MHMCYHCGGFSDELIACYGRVRYHEGKQHHESADGICGCGFAVASGASLDLCGNSQTLSTLVGAGCVTNGAVSLETLVADCAATEWPTVNGTFRIMPGQKVSVANWPYPSMNAMDIKILSATLFEGTENVSAATFVGKPERLSARLRIRRNGDLVAHIGTVGLVVTVR